MIASDTAHLALRNLRQAVLRTVLTSLGVAIGIASLVGMLSFGVALQDQVLGSFTRSGLFDSITVTPAAPNTRRRPASPQARRFREAIGPSKQATPRTRLDDEALKEMARLDKVREVFPDVRVPVEVVYEDSSELSAVRGVPMSSRNESGFQHLASGRFFSSETEEACLVSLEFARRLTDREPKQLLGKQVTLRYVTGADLAQMNPIAAATGGLNINRTERKFTIVGIVERQTGINLGMFSSVMIPLAKARELGAYDISDIQSVLRQMGDKRTYNMATVKVARPQDTEEVERKIRDMGFNAMSIADVIENNKRAFILLNLFLGLVGSIALAVASLGIINTMVMSILERTREIGVMKAIGASDRDVRRIFLIEASLIGIIGGVSGILLGWAVGRAINVGANYYLRSQGAETANLFMIPFWLVAAAIGFALFVSLLAGSFPASRAARLDPIQALRHD